MKQSEDTFQMFQYQTITSTYPQPLCPCAVIPPISLSKESVLGLKPTPPLGAGAHAFLSLQAHCSAVIVFLLHHQLAPLIRSLELAFKDALISPTLKKNFFLSWMS